MKTGRSQESDQLQQQIAAKQQQIAQHSAQFERQMQGEEKSKPNQDLQRFRKEFQIRASVLNQQLQNLNKTIQEITEKLTAKNSRSVELEVQAAELEQLKQIAADMSIKLEMMDVESAAPPRVRVIQWAM